MESRELDYRRLTAYRVVMKPSRSVLGSISLLPGAEVFVMGITISGDKATTLAHVSLKGGEKWHTAVLNEMSRRAEVVGYRILNKKRGSLTLAVTKNLCEFYEYTMGTGRFTFLPYVIREGRREFYLASQEKPEEILSSLSKHGQILSFERVPLYSAIKNTGMLGLKITVSDTMTPLQMSILKKAVSLGYFDWPRRVSLSELARELGISKATLSEHIRRSEQKILDLVLNQL